MHERMNSSLGAEAGSQDTLPHFQEPLRDAFCHRGSISEPRGGEEKGPRPEEEESCTEAAPEHSTLQCAEPSHSLPLAEISRELSKQHSRANEQTEQTRKKSSFSSLQSPRVFFVNTSELCCPMQQTATTRGHLDLN